MVICYPSYLTTGDECFFNFLDINQMDCTGVSVDKFRSMSCTVHPLNRPNIANGTMHLRINFLVTG